MPVIPKAPPVWGTKPSFRGTVQIQNTAVPMPEPLVLWRQKQIREGGRAQHCVSVAPSHSLLTLLSAYCLLWVLP